MTFDKWSVSADFAGRLCVVSETPYCVENPDAAKPVICNAYGDESNAKLIAAAPDLLKALEDMVGMVQMNLFEKDVVMGIAKKAISKAKGE